MNTKKPVVDIKIGGAMTVNDLISQMSNCGGFTAKKLSDAVDITERMLKRKTAQFSFHSLPA